MGSVLSEDATNGTNGTKPYDILDEPNGRRTHIKVVCVGAGATGLYLAYQMEQRMKNYELIVYEKNKDIGGTWLENRYPGCACDIPGHLYTYSFRPHPTWSSYYAESVEIHDYFKDFEREFRLDRYIQLEHMVTNATWNGDRHIYDIQIQGPHGEVKSDWCHVLINAAGILNKWKWPSIPGLHSFNGQLLHSAAWDENADMTGKSVALIGTGSSGIQITPKAQKVANHLDVFIRSPTWIAPQLGGLQDSADDPMGEGDTEVNRILVKGSKPYKFTTDEIKRFKEDPEMLLHLRRKMECLITFDIDVFRKGTLPQKKRQEILTRSMEDALEGHDKIKKHLIPSFPAGCRRITPGEGYLNSLIQPNVTCVYSDIISVNQFGLNTADGNHYPVDMLICATGFDVSFVPSFELKGIDGVNIRDAWDPDPECYLGIAASGFPNYFIVLGPRGPWGNGTIIPAIEINVDYFINMMEKMQREKISEVEIKPEAVADFTQHCDKWHEDSIWTGSCRSWYKRGDPEGKPFLWCGHAPAYYKTMKHMRYEDWNYKHQYRNRFAYLGNGKIEADYVDGSEKADRMAAYIRNENVPWYID